MSGPRAGTRESKRITAEFWNFISWILCVFAIAENVRNESREQPVDRERERGNE